MVDDSDDFLAALRSALESCGFAVSCARSYRQALSEVGAHRPDVILTDVYMPGGCDGFDLLSALHGHDETMPVVVMSGGSHLGDYDPLDAARGLSASATISKPFRAYEIAAVLRRAIAVPA